MPQNHPALSLLIGLCLILSIGVPVLAWLLLMGRRDRPASLWFGGLLCSAVGVLVIALLHRSNGLTAALMSVTIVLLTVAIRSDLPPFRVRWWRTAAWLSVYELLQFWLDAAGLRMSWGIVLTSTVLSLQEAVALAWVWRAMRRHRSRGLLVVALGLLLVLASNAVRLFTVLLDSQAAPIFSFTIASNLTILSVTVSTVLLSFGYVLFMLEKAHVLHLADVQASARAEERRQAAQEHADALQQMVEQRDAMILMNSRFSAVNSLAIFNSAIVHEISQPLQALRMLLEMVALLPNAQHDERRERLAQVHEVLQGMGQTLKSLRDLVQMQEPRLEEVPVGAALREIEPILQTQARHRGVILRGVYADGLDSAPAQLQKVMLQRIVFNLMTNALEALEAQATRAGGAPPLIVLSAHLRAQHGNTWLVVQVQDNGPGLPQQVLERGEQPFFTTKPQGMGMGLALSRVIVQSWRGELRFHNLPQAEGGGASVELWLPVRAA